MKKTLIALAVLGAAAGVAHAQSNVTIYGIVDTGFIKKSGQDVKMGENVNNRLGFRGVEDLGGGQKATFELERRFDLNNGTEKGDANPGFDGASNVGLKGDNWGAVRLGRVNELTTETIRKFDPFYQYGVGGMFDSTQRSARISNTIRYDSLNWSGFHFGASYTLGGNTNSKSIKGIKYNDNGTVKELTGMAEVKDEGADNDGYGIMLGYDNGPLALVGNWSRLADSKDSSVWNLGAAYRFGPAKIELVYQQTKDKGWRNGERSDWNNGEFFYGGWASTDEMAKYEGTNELKEKQWLLGLEWKLGPGRLNASAQYMEVEAVGSAASDKDVYKYALGYTYDLSKRTSLYGIVAYTDYDDEAVARVFGDVEDSVTGVQVGITHRF